MTDGRDTARWTDEEMRAYLLDTLGADRKAALEEQIFDDEHAYEALLDARYDLLDDYARDVLSPPERGQVERRLLDAAGESALGLADLLARRQPLPALQVAHDRPSRRGGQRLLVLAAAAALVMAVGVATWLALDNRRLRADLARVTAVPPVVPRPAAADGLVARLELTPRTTRSAAAPEFTIAPAAAVVEVVVPVDEIAPEYRVTLEGRNGVLWTGRGITRATDGALHVWLAAAQLPDGAYELLVHGGLVADAPLIVAVPFRIRR